MQIKSSDKIPFEELSLICFQVNQCHRLHKSFRKMQNFITTYKDIMLHMLDDNAAIVKTEC